MEDIRETVYEHLAGNKTFAITAVEQWSITMIKRLAKERPDEVEIIAENADSSLLARVPFDWMRIVPKKKIVLSDERKAELAERLRSSRVST
jgi:hypothetical protein